MKKVILTIAFLFCFCFVNILHAQNSFGISYSVGIPTKDLSNFIGNTSFRGAIIDFQSRVNPNIGIGISVGMNTFYTENTYSTYTVDNVAISGKQWRYSNHVPVLLTGDYYFKQKNKRTPYVGLGLGMMYTRRNTDMYIYTIEQQAWNFTVQPEIGFLINNVNISAKYNFGLQAGSELKQDQSYLSINLGYRFGDL